LPQARHQRGQSAGKLRVNSRSNLEPTSIPLVLCLRSTNHVQFGQCPANRTIQGELETMSPMLFVRSFRHRTQSVILRVQLRGGYDVVAQVVRNMSSALRYLHNSSVHPPGERINYNRWPMFRLMLMIYWRAANDESGASEGRLIYFHSAIRMALIRKPASFRAPQFVAALDWRGATLHRAERHQSTDCRLAKSRQSHQPHELDPCAQQRGHVLSHPKSMRVERWGNPKNHGAAHDVHAASNSYAAGT